MKYIDAKRLRAEITKLLDSVVSCPFIEAAFFNLLPKGMAHKSKRHHDGEECFGGGWFIVMANLPTGQISNHYELKDWDLFQIPEKEFADEWDGHTPQEAAERLRKYLQQEQPEEDLEKEMYNKATYECDIIWNEMEFQLCYDNLIEAFVAGAEWAMKWKEDKK